MRKYVFALVLTAEAGKDEAKTKKMIETLVTKADGKVAKVTVLGLKDLAYPIKGKTRGWYGFFTIELPADKAKALEDQVKVTEQILRHLLIVEV